MMHRLKVTEKIIAFIFLMTCLYFGSKQEKMNNGQPNSKIDIETSFTN